MAKKTKEVAQLLDAISKGDINAKKKLFALLYGDLHAMAHKVMRREAPNITMQTTALVHETFMSLVKNEKGIWKNQGHFYSIAARAMRYILVDEARKRKASKRKGDRRITSFEQLEASRSEILSSIRSFNHIEALNDAFERLSEHDPRKCAIVELRFFAGLTIDKTAEVLGISEATVKRSWEATREWLRKELKQAGLNI